MRWRDVRFEPPTEADANAEGRILQLLESGAFTTWNWKNLNACVAWLPLSEVPKFDPIPDPPEGWRFVQKDEAFDKRAKFWHIPDKVFLATKSDHYTSSIYIVPIDPPIPEGYRKAKAGDEGRPDCKMWKADRGVYIDRWQNKDNAWPCEFADNEFFIVPIDPPAPPEPTYRPFANAAEFDGWAFNFWRYKDDLRSVRRSPMSYSDDGHYGDKWDVSLIRKEFADGSPFGVKVE